MDSRLLGREREIGVIDDAIAKLFRGERAVVVVTGEPGIGKTRMLDELTARVASRGGAVAWGRALEVGITPAFWPWHEALGALAAAGDRPPDVAASSRGDGQRGWLALVEDVVGYLDRRPTVALIFDDSHAADLSSLLLLERVAPRTRVLVALAARDGEAERDIANALGRIQRNAYRLPLARLDRAQVIAMVGDRANASKVWELSEGNPLFVEELVAAGGSLPDVSSVRAVIRQRIAKLPPATGDVLVEAAVVGREFRGQVIADMLGHAIDDDLAPAVRLGFVHAIGQDRYRFSHALVAQALADELDAASRARSHLRAAHAIERREPDDTAARAHHLLSAGHLSASAAVDAAETAGQQSRARLAFDDAARFFEHALSALVLAAPDDRIRRIQLLCARAEALQHSSQHRGAAELCDQAAELARRLDDPGDHLSRIAHVRGLEWTFGRPNPLLIAALHEALTYRPRDPRLLARLAAAEQPAPDARAPIARALMAIELAHELPPRERLDIMFVATSALIDFPTYVDVRPILDETLALAVGRDRWIAVHTRLRIAFAALEAIDRTTFAEAKRAFTADATALGLPHWLRFVDLLDALVAALEGRFDDADRHIATLAYCSAELGDTNTAWTLDVHRLFVAWTRTVPAPAGVWERIGSHPSVPSVTDAWRAVGTGDRDAAAAALARCSEDELDADLAVMVVAATVFVGDRARAARLYDLLAPRSGRVVVASMAGCSILDLYDRLLLELATMCEQWDRADHHAETALAIATRLASPVWTTRVRADCADSYAARGRLDRASELRATALPDAERMGMLGVVARCGRPAGPGGPGRPGQPGHPGHPDGQRRAPAHDGGEGVTVERVGELWLVAGFGEAVHVKDSRGMQMLERLVAERGREIHALDLGGSGGGSDVDTGDAGELLDATARRAYRTRVAELTAERDEAESFGDHGRSERATIELDALTAELARAVGLGGRDRKAASAAERARTNVQRRVSHALQVIRSSSTRLGEHLAATVHTGTYCIYDLRPS